MKAAYDVGINFFDCAEGYSGGESERVMGQAIKKFGWKRNDLVISTKVHSPLNPPITLAYIDQAKDQLGISLWREPSKQ